MGMIPFELASLNTVALSKQLTVLTTLKFQSMTKVLTELTMFTSEVPGGAVCESSVAMR